MPEPGQSYPSPEPQTGTTSGSQRQQPPVQSSSSQPTPSANQPVVQKAPPRSAHEISSPAVMSLLGSADTLAQGGHMDAAASTLERALDLDPRNPFIYQRLAAVRLAQGQNGQAEQMAMKSNSVSNNNPFVEASNWQLIAEARHSAGNTQGASKAKAQAVNYRQSAAQYDQ
ncbi:tetratricopeptide repeat protein [Salinisphaera sp. SPP-AMP-43]|uniref:tetratricopeptide repeat protein n=1 Tax=Salinisphaera sp. SPP-AMP-43 TaxID=3121288 RepID=UPI003C6E891B